MQHAKFKVYDKIKMSDFGIDSLKNLPYFYGTIIYAVTFGDTALNMLPCYNIQLRTGDARLLVNEKHVEKASAMEQLLYF